MQSPILSASICIYNYKLTLKLLLQLNLVLIIAFIFYFLKNHANEKLFFETCDLRGKLINVAIITQSSTRESLIHYRA